MLSICFIGGHIGIAKIIILKKSHAMNILVYKKKILTFMEIVPTTGKKIISLEICDAHERRKKT